MNKWLTLKVNWQGHKAGAKIELDASTADELVKNGTATAVEADADPVKAASQRIIDTVVQGITGAIPTIVDTEVKKRMTQAAGTTGLDQRVTAPGDVTGIHNNAADDPTGGFKTFAEFAIAVYMADKPGRRTVDERLLVQAPSGMSEGDDEGGGFLVPTQHIQTLMKLAWEESGVLGRCTNIPMQTNTVDIPVLRNTDRRAGYRNGGIRVYWVAEAEQKTASRPKFDRIGLKLNEMAGLVYVTNTLLEDSPVSLEPLLGGMFAEEFALTTEDAVLRGTGAGMPLGIIGHPGTIAISKEVGQAATTLVAENIIKMWARMWGPSKRNAVWLINGDVLPQLMTMTINVGTGGIPIWMPANSLAGREYSTLLGRPVIELETCSTLGTVGDVILADFSHYLIGQKSRAIETASSIHLRFDYDETAFRYVMRLDGQPWLRSTITPMNGSNTRSPFITVETRS